MRKCMTIATVAAVVLACVSGVQATVAMETVTVGNPGNPGDTRYPSGGVPSFGGVDYAYNMGTYEVTAGQYAEFLNAVATTDTYGLYNGSMWSETHGCKIQQSGSSPNYTYSVDPDRADRPVNYVSWYDTLRFANWMHNGQGGGDTENGAYTMSLGSNVVRNPGAMWFLPTEDEWYKSAYHKNDGVTGNYWDYPMGSSATPDNGNPGGDTGNSANFWDGDYTIGSPYWRTEVGYFGLSDSPYGTFDQGGNVLEWNEALIGSNRGLRGGSFNNLVYPLASSYRYYYYPYYEHNIVGFRVASEVP